MNIRGSEAFRNIIYINKLNVKTPRCKRWWLGCSKTANEYFWVPRRHFGIVLAFFNTVLNFRQFQCIVIHDFLHWICYKLSVCVFGYYNLCYNYKMLIRNHFVPTFLIFCFCCLLFWLTSSNFSKIATSKPFSFLSFCLY